MSDLPLVVSSALLGLLVGSFLNVVVWRVPRRESVVHPPSACPACGRPIRRRDNVPVLSWLLLRGRCRDCGTTISVRYPTVEVVTALLFALVALRFDPWAVPAYAYLAAIGVALALIDLQTHRLPNVIVLPSYPVLVVLLTLASGGTGDWSALGRAMIGGVALWVAYFLLCLAHPGGMGFGDVKLAGLLGAALAWMGWGAFAVGSFGAFLLGGVFALVLLATRRARRGSGIPFGPWMLLGAALGIGVGEQVWGWYVGLLT